MLSGLGLFGLGVGLGLLLGLIGWGLVGLALVILGAGVLIANNRFGVRTPTGSAVLAQTKGFELYLTTAEAAAVLRAHRTTVERWLRSGDPQGEEVGGSWRIRRAALSRRHLGAPRYFLFEIPLQLSQLADS